jgi:POT family proton-dependent oligopeptide transporter
MASPTTPSSTPSTVPPHIANGPTWLGHPRGLFLLFMVEMWERFSYYGMRGLLVLYLIAVVQVRDQGPGSYSNRVSFSETPKLEDPNAKKPDADIQWRELVAVVGSAKAPAPGDTTVVGAPKLDLIRLKAGEPDPKNHEVTWAPDDASDTPQVVMPVSTDKKVKPPAVAWEIHNPTGQTIELEVRCARSKSTEPTYFLLNDSSGVVKFVVKPDAERKEDEKPPRLVVMTSDAGTGRNWFDKEAYTLYGWYTGMVYLLPILGGLIADKLIGTHRSMVVGGLLIALGHIALCVSGVGPMSVGAEGTGMTVFVFGLALIVIGTAHFKPSVSVMVGQLYNRDDPRRESAFSIFYMGINLGAFLCNLVCGTLAAAYGWHWGFGAAAVGMLLSLAMYTVMRPKYLAGIGDPQRGGGGAAPVFLPVGIALAALVALAFHQGLLGGVDEFFSNTVVFSIIIALAIMYGVWCILKQKPEDKGPVATIFIYMLFNAVFWLAFEQAGSSLNTFTERYTDRNFAGTDVPSPYFQSINPLLIIVLAPILGVFWANLARKKKSVAQPVKIGLGLFFVGLGYVVMVLAAMRLGGSVAKVSMFFIAGTYFLHTVGEIILSPTGLSYVAKTAPRDQVSSLMGIWFISSFVAGLMSGKVATLVEPIMEGKAKLPWHLGGDGQADFFLLFVVTSLAAAAAVFLLSPVLVRLQRSRGD